MKSVGSNSYGLPKVNTPTSVSMSAHQWLTWIGFVDPDTEFLTTDGH